VEEAAQQGRGGLGTPNSNRRRGKVVLKPHLQHQKGEAPLTRYQCIECRDAASTHHRWKALGQRRPMRGSRPRRRFACMVREEGKEP